MTPRAPALPPDQRRAAILRAARPLLLQQGGSFTTRQAAEAAGIAEGTLFRIFDTKQDLLQAVIADALDPTAICTDLDAIDRQAGLQERVTLVVERLQRGIEEVSSVMAALFQMPGADGLDGSAHHSPEARARCEGQAEQVHRAIGRVLAADAEALACTLDEAAILVRQTAFATAHPHLSHAPSLSPGRLAELLLAGLAPTCSPRHTSDKESSC